MGIAVAVRLVKVWGAPTTPMVVVDVNSGPKNGSLVTVVVVCVVEPSTVTVAVLFVKLN